MASAGVDDYLAVKQAFYHGHKGAEKGELLALALCLPLSIVLTEELKSWWQPGPGHGGVRRRYLHGILFELVLVVLPQVALFMGGLPPVQSCMALLLLATCIWAGHAIALIPGHHHSPPSQHSDCPSIYAGTASATRVSASGPKREGSYLQASKGKATGVDGKGEILEAVLQQSPAAVYERLADMAGARRSWVTCFRGGLMLYTVISILAVDFRAFPRRYAKTEMYGTGLMDMGVGGMMVAGGMVSRTTKVPAASRSLLRDLAAGVRAAGPSWLLWILRLVSLRAVDYHEHVGEYGVHWNFFASVAMVALLSHAVRVPPRCLPALAAMVTCIHQVALSYGGLGAWGLKEERDMSSLVDMNKEGLVSVLGYWALYLWGAAFATASAGTLQGALRQVAHNLGLEEDLSIGPLSLSGEGGSTMAGGLGKANGCLHSRRAGREVCSAAGVGGSACQEESKGSHNSVEGVGGAWTGDKSVSGAEVSGRVRGGGAIGKPVRMWAVLWPVLEWIGGWTLCDLLLWAALVWVEAHIDPVSRRLCNLAFILWVCAFCGALLLPLLLAQALLPTTFCPSLPAAFNRNMLPLFLVANLLTGVVNLSMNTLSISDPLALGVISVYATIVCCLAAGLDVWDIKIGLSHQKRT